jgi:uncharacterized membrane protein
MDKITFLIIYFTVYSFLGWIVESGYRSLFLEKRFINSGFLYGPFIPIYGFGSTGIYLLTHIITPLYFPLQIALLTIIITFFEYLSSFILEKIFSIKLWDYSNEIFNIHGRICLLFVLFWAVLITVNLLFVQPFFILIIDNIDPAIRIFSSSMIIIYFFIDTIFSGRIYFRFAEVLRSVQEFVKKGTIFQNPALFSKIKFSIESRKFLHALRTMPNLSDIWNKNWKSFSPEGVPMTMKWISDFFKRKTGGEWIVNGKSFVDDAEFNGYISNIIGHPVYLELKKYHHHDASIYDHSLQVAWLSYRLGRIFKLNLKEMVKGAMLHDFFLYDWRSGKPKTGGLHAFDHPAEALMNSEKYFSPLTGLEKDIILKHMWPLTIKPPKYFESLIVCLVDKIVATKEFSIEIARLIKTGKHKNTK